MGKEGGLIDVVKFWMDGEIKTFSKIWVFICICLCYCYFAGKTVSKGIPRFFSLLPVICIFLILPLPLHSPSLGGNTAFFIAWLANFKLLMLAFGIGPLSHPSISLRRFLTLACLPIKVHLDPKPKRKPSQNGHFQEHPSPQIASNGESAHNPSQNGQFQEHPSHKFASNGESEHNASQDDQFQEDPPQKHPSNTKSEQSPSQNDRFKESPSKGGHKSPSYYAVKALVLAFILVVCAHGERLHPNALLFAYSIYLYLILELILVAVGSLARTMLGLDLEPQFDEPYLSTSLQDFWGRRWNLMVTRTLRPIAYDPVRLLAMRFLRRESATAVAIMTTFAVSGLMHELIFYYLGRLMPTWEATCFFLLHGICLVAEITIKKAFPGFLRLPRIVSIFLTIGFVMITGFWLFFPPLIRTGSDVRSFEEYAAIGAFVKDLGQALTTSK